MKNFSPRAKSNSTWPTIAYAQTSPSPVCSPSPGQLKVTFSPSPIITGYSLPLASSTISRRLTATVNLPACVFDINFPIAGVDRVDFTVVSRDQTTGTILIDVKGNALGPTPSTSPNGDTTIQAQYTPTGEIVGQVQAIVVVPTRIATPHPTANGPVNGSNRAANVTTSPVSFDANVMQANLWTICPQWLPVAVNDQFGNRLDSLYQGVDVAELYNNTWYNINQKLDAQGTYSDPVGVFQYKNLSPIGWIVPWGSAEANAWPNDPMEPFNAGYDQTQTIPVKVGGHQLQDGVIGRRVQGIAPNTVEITWP